MPSVTFLGDFPTLPSFVRAGGTVGAHYPIALTLKEAGALWWKIKNYNVVSNFDMDDGSGAHVTLPNSACTRGGSNSSTELDLIQSGSRHDFFPAVAGPSLGGLSILLMNDSPDVLLDGGNYYPAFYVTGNLEFSNGSVGQVNVSSVAGEAGTNTVAATLNGKAFTLYWGYGVSAPSGFVFSSFDIVATDFWAY